MGFFDRLAAFLGGGNGDAPEGSASDGVEMISCHDALRLVHEYLDGELDDLPAEQVRAHFDVCQQCYPHLHLENVCRDALRRAAGAQAAPPELKAKIAALIREEDVSS